MANTEFDAQIIEEFARRLYKRASSMIVSYTAAGILLGLIAGAAVSMFGTQERGGDQAPNAVAAIVGALLAGAMGYAAGQSKAFQIRLQAQMALCQLQIEKNTRKEEG